MEIKSACDKLSQIENPRPAATIILTRHYKGELQVYLLKRSLHSGFMPGNYVFPGGTVDPQDRASEFWKAHVDMDSKSISSRLGGGLTIDELIAYGVAAIRETFEEAGVLLAHQSQRTRDDLKKVCHRREVDTLPKGWLREWVSSEGWTLEFSRLSRWSHWITPVTRYRRYDTRFFLTIMPPGQQCTSDNLETTHGIWISPEKGLRANLKGDIPLSPPTLVTLHELLMVQNKNPLEKDLQKRQWESPRIPLLIRSSRETMIVLPWDPMYGQGDGLDVNTLTKVPLTVGEDFSRLWYQEGIWKPVQD